MDWSKAKTILIIAFLITNMLLGIFVVSNGKIEDPTLSEEFRVEVVNMLRGEEIELNTNIPLIIPSLPPIIVEYEELKSSKINKDFFNGAGKIELKEDDFVEIIYVDEIISINNNKILEYENLKEKIKYRNLDKEIVKNIALEFIEDNNLERENMRLTSINQREDNYIVRFNKFYNNKYVERAYLNIYIDGTGVKRARKLWLDVKEGGEKELYINTAPKAILSLLNNEQAKGKTIEDISLCYYFDPEQDNYLDEPSNAKKGNTIPAWRVLLDDGTRIIIDNY